MIGSKPQVNRPHVSHARHPFVYVLINLNGPIANCLRISVKTTVYTNVRFVVVGVVNLLNTRKIGLQVDHRLMSRHLIMNFLMGLIHKLKVQAQQQLITVAHKGQCNKKWFAANKKDRMQTKKIGCKQKTKTCPDANKKDRMQTKKDLQTKKEME